jgi:hypothetical protein
MLVTRVCFRWPQYQTPSGGVDAKYNGKLAYEEFHGSWILQDYTENNP